MVSKKTIGVTAGLAGLATAAIVAGIKTGKLNRNSASDAKKAITGKVKSIFKKRAPAKKAVAKRAKTTKKK